MNFFCCNLVIFLEQAISSKNKKNTELFDRTGGMIDV